MIKIQSGYYSVQQQPKQTQKPQSDIQKVQQKQQSLPLQVVGDIKGYINHVAAQIKKIKQMKNKQKQEQLQNTLILDQLIISRPNKQTSQIKLQIAVPAQIYELDKRIQQLEQTIINDEVVKQKVQRKGKLAERARSLLVQIQKLTQKSPEIIGANIQNFCKSLDEKQDQSKTLFLYEAFNKTNTLSQEIETLNIYLTNLNQIQTKMKSLPPQSVIVDNHQKLLAKRASNQQRLATLAKHMNTEYEKLVKQIDSI